MATQLQEWQKNNFNTILRAAHNDDLALLDCTDAKTGEQVPTLVAVSRDEEGNYTFTPLARLFSGDPYEEVLPPY